ncbi:MAG: SHOCT domain-containing protein [Bacillota bacterium]
MTWTHGWGMGAGWGLFGILWMLIMAAFWIGIIALIIYVALRVFKHFGMKLPIEGQRLDSPLDILKRRFAAGEINAEEYQQIKKELMD